MRRKPALGLGLRYVKLLSALKVVGGNDNCLLKRKIYPGESQLFVYLVAARSLRRWRGAD